MLFSHGMKLARGLPGAWPTCLASALATGVSMAAEAMPIDTEAYRFMMGGGGTPAWLPCAFIAMLIALSLTLAPFTAAWAMKAVPASPGMATAHGDMPHCHKAKHRGTHSDHGCCCDHSKSNCPDSGCSCLFKCGAQILAMAAAQDSIRSAGNEEFFSLSLAKPPDLQINPSAPPPRA